MMRISALTLVAAAALGAVFARSQQAPPPALHTPASHTPAHEVRLPITVRDKHGALVTTLTPADITLTEDGRAQTVKSFSVQSDLPFAVGLIVQTSQTTTAAIEDERKATTKFVDTLLAPHGKDEIFLLHFDREVELLRDFTADTDKLHREIEDMGPSSRSRDDRNGPEQTGDDRNSARSMRATAQLYDAIFLAADELMKSKEGRKLLIVYSDGVDRGSKESMSEAMDAADHAGLSVYAVYIKGEQPRSNSGFPGGNQRRGNGGSWPGGSGGGYPGGGGGYPGGGGGGRNGGGRSDEPTVDGKKIMQQIAERSGGRFYEAKKHDNLEEIYADIATELRGQYLLTYTPDMVDNDGGFHKVSIKTKKDDLQLLTRAGYYASDLSK